MIFHIGCAASPDIAVGNLALKRRIRPVAQHFLGHGNHILMSDKRYRLKRRVGALPEVYKTCPAYLALFERLMEQRVFLSEQFMKLFKLVPVNKGFVGIGNCLAAYRLADCINVSVKVDVLAVEFGGFLFLRLIQRSPHDVSCGECARSGQHGNSDFFLHCPILA